MRTIAILLLGLVVTDSAAREPALDLRHLVAVELATVAMDPMSGAPVVLLREPISGEVVPILIGFAEARAILMALREVPVPRPMTHDLIGTLLTATGARLERVLVDALVDDTYLGLLELRVSESENLIYVDSRPSDALAVAVRTGAAIAVAPAILVAGRDLRYEGLEEQVVTALGITVVPAAAALRGPLGLPADAEGVLVSRVEGLAVDAGVTPGSLILTVNGESPTSPMGFLELVRRTPADSEVQLRYLRDGETHSASLPTTVSPVIAPDPSKQRT